ncbi:MAG: 3-dehydroquinate synthase [Gammaproteobacteria bacterium]|nr:3-dehydroquinate synthase [Gammaproteobacteria bacterium]
MIELEVALGERSYPVLIGAGLLRQAGVLAPYLAGNQAMVVTNRTVAPLYLDSLRAALGQVRADVFELDDGERFKTLESYSRIVDALLEQRHSRSTTLIALGGGVVGDIAGFVAATYQRGVRFVQVPTTLLAQVDSSVGGKTAVNHPLGKNMIGAFHQPGCVLADTDTLATLPEREYRAGLAEVLKYGVIRDEPFFAWMESGAAGLLRRDPDALAHAIETSCAIKARVVAADERESGLRAILNFGHTFAHAIETLTDYKRLLHGEAVAIGMALAADCSVRHGMIGERDASRVLAVIRALGLPVEVPAGIGASAMLDAMAVDKKAVDGRIRLVLARTIGEASVVQTIERGALLATLSAACDG